MEDINKQLTDLRKKRDALMTSFFKLGLQIALIFGIPAAAAAILGTQLDKAREGSTFTMIFLGCAFVLSWAIVIRRYQKQNAKIEAVEKEIRDLKESLPKKEEN
jgi:Na+/melibiose symporter-like transporter